MAPISIQRIVRLKSRKGFSPWLSATWDSSNREVANLALALFEHHGRLYTFLECQGVEPTNNSAERALRTGVQWRKISFGNRSADGEPATARLLTVAETCDLQHINILGYPSTAIASHGTVSRRLHCCPDSPPELLRVFLDPMFRRRLGDLGQSLRVDEKGMVRLELKLIPKSKMQPAESGN